MRIETKQTVKHGGQWRWPGAVIEVPDDLGRTLVQNGAAREISPSDSVSAGNPRPAGAGSAEKPMDELTQAVLEAYQAGELTKAGGVSVRAVENRTGVETTAARVAEIAAALKEAGRI